MSVWKLVAGIAASLLLVACGEQTQNPPQAETAQTRINFVTDWKAQAEHGGFYQALAEGLYAKRGLDVVIRQGGPSVNVPQILAGGAADFGMGSNAFIPLNLVREGAKIKAVMAVFQKDPQVLITHPRDDVKSIADMKGKPILIGDASTVTFWPWLKAKFGFTDAQIRKYTFNLAPFLVDKNAIQEGYLSSEPYSVQKEGGFVPQIFPLADAGYPGYANMVLVPESWIAERPQIVQAFVDASIEGWMRYLYGDASAANALIKKDNPEMTDDLIAQAIDKMKSFGIALSGAAETQGLGAMSDTRWQEFFDTMSAEGVYQAGLPYRDAYTLQFVNKGYGLDAGRAVQ
ncbi:MAG: ABC transporter substrate-binding protein [Alphaproteobacteria bacterium]|nr:ABC transporter substrate-binding protein [Alphaproteobacteria bacterium]